MLAEPRGGTTPQRGSLERLGRRGSTRTVRPGRSSIRSRRYPSRMSDDKRSNPDTERATDPRPEKAERPAPAPAERTDREPDRETRDRETRDAR